MGNRFSAALGNADPWKRDLDNDSDRLEEEKTEVVYRMHAKTELIT